MTFSLLFLVYRPIFFFFTKLLFSSSQLNRRFNFSEISLSTAQPKHMYQYNWFGTFFLHNHLIRVFFFFYFFDIFRYIAKTSHTHFILYERHKSTKKKCYGSSVSFPLRLSKYTNFFHLVGKMNVRIESKAQFFRFFEFWNFSSISSLDNIYGNFTSNLYIESRVLTFFFLVFSFKLMFSFNTSKQDAIY